ncbi:MAG: metallophosphoesterase [Clostridia bacterium]|nr:metallophosphoesterase [Clostridia bacterium]
MKFFQKHRALAVLSVLLAVLLAAVLILVLISVKQNETILVTDYTVSHEQIPASFEGKRIVQVTDLHNKDFGDQLPTKVAAQHPDVIVITGDMISRNSEEMQAAVRQIRALTPIAPVFYIAGNHEGRSPVYAAFSDALQECGVTVLENRGVTWEVNGEQVQLIGAFPPEFGTYLSRDLTPLIDESQYAIVLLHHPDQFPTAVDCGADLVLSGHTHGGQIRLPLIGALYAPEQGLFPTYDVGQFEKDGATLIVSQGLGEAALMRILTPPEIVVVTLDSPHV